MPVDLAKFVTYAQHLYMKGMPVNRQSFENLIELGEIQMTHTELAALFDNSRAVTEFHKLVRLRGLTPPGESNLSAKQIVALGKVGNILDRRPIRVRLEEIGVEWWEWQSWLANPVFAEQYRAQAELNIERSQATVLDAMTSAAVGGDLRAIEYFNKVSGRFDPNKVDNADLRTVIIAIMEILQFELKDHPDLLVRIGRKIAAKSPSSKELLP